MALHSVFYDITQCILWNYTVYFMTLHSVFYDITQCIL